MRLRLLLITAQTNRLVRNEELGDETAAFNDATCGAFTVGVRSLPLN